MNPTRPVVACLLVAALLAAGAGSSLAGAQDAPGGQPEEAEEGVVETVVGSAAFGELGLAAGTLSAARATLPPGGELAAVRVPGPALVVVGRGDLQLGGPQRQWPNLDSTFGPGQQAVLTAGMWIRPRNPGEVPVTFLVVALTPPGWDLGGPAAGTASAGWR